jgi:hypothetical protein
MRVPRTGPPRGAKPSASTAAGVSAPDANDEHDWFADRAEAAGLKFVHFNGMSGQFYFPEIMPPGVGLLDYDKDGDLDVFLVPGDMVGPGKTISDALVKPGAPAAQPTTATICRWRRTGRARCGSPTSPHRAESTRAAWHGRGDRRR